MTRGARDQPVIRSRKVRKILKLEAAAAALEAKVQAAMAATEAKVQPLRARIRVLRDEAKAMEGILTGGQLGELRRARAAP